MSQFLETTCNKISSDTSELKAMMVGVYCLLILLVYSVLNNTSGAKKNTDRLISALYDIEVATWEITEGE